MARITIEIRHSFSVLVLGAKGRLTRDNSNFIDRPCPNITRFNHRQDLCQMLSSPNFILKMNLLQCGQSKTATNHRSSFDKRQNFKGIVHQFSSYCSNLIFWTVMGCRGPLRRESRSLVAPRVEVPGDKMKTQKC